MCAYIAGLYIFLLCFCGTILSQIAITGQNMGASVCLCACVCYVGCITWLACMCAYLAGQHFDCLYFCETIYVHKLLLIYENHGSFRRLKFHMAFMDLCVSTCLFIQTCTYLYTYSCTVYSYYPHYTYTPAHSLQDRYVYFLLVYLY